MIELLKLRKEIKDKKPKFIRQDSVLKGLSNKWHKPKGLQSKLRLNKAGHRKKPSQGYRSPRKVRFLDSSGLKPKLIHNLKELENLDPKTESAIIFSKIGLRKKTELLNKSKELKIPLINIPNIDEYLKKSQEKLSKKRELSQKRKERKQKSKKDLEEKSKEKKETKKEEKKKDLTQKIEKEKPKQEIQKSTKQQVVRATAPKQK